MSRRFGIDWRVWQDWTGLVAPARHNWVDFTLIELHFEWVRYNDYRPFEFHAALLGFHLYVDVVDLEAVRRNAAKEIQ